MKHIVTAMFAVFSLSAFAENVPGICYDNAATFAEAFTLKSPYGARYDREGFQAYECYKSPVGKAIVCDVAASKGDGAALDTYRVVMNITCKKPFSVTLTGEE